MFKMNKNYFFNLTVAAKISGLMKKNLLPAIKDHYV